MPGRIGPIGPPGRLVSSDTIVSLYYVNESFLFRVVKVIVGNQVFQVRKEEHLIETVLLITLFR